MESSFREEVRSLLPEDEAQWLKDRAYRNVTHDQLDSPRADTDGTFFTVVPDPLTFDTEELEDVVEEEKLLAVIESPDSEPRRTGEPHYVPREDVDLIQWAMYEIPLFAVYVEAERAAVDATDRWSHGYAPGQVVDGQPDGIMFGERPAEAINFTLDPEYSLQRQEYKRQ